MKLVLKKIEPGETIYDLGKINPMAELMIQADYIVNNNVGNADIDLVQSEIRALTTQSEGLDSPSITTAFDILQNLSNPFNVLKAIQTRYLLITAPVNSMLDEYKLRVLLDKVGFRILDSGKWRIQRRPFIYFPFSALRPSYVWFYCENRQYFLKRYDGKTFQQLKEIEDNLRREVDVVVRKMAKVAAMQEDA